MKSRDIVTFRRKIMKRREEGEATREDKGAHHKGWARVEGTCPEGQSSCTTWPIVQVILYRSRRKWAGMSRSEAGHCRLGVRGDCGEEPDKR